MSTALSGRTGSSDVERLARAQHPGIVTVAKVGWVAKGVVYGLLGVLAVPIALHGSGADDGGSGSSQASQSGAVARIAASGAGTLALWLVAVGLCFYVAWRLVCVVLPAGNGAKAWATRIGYLVSAATYVALAWTAISFARDSPAQPAQGGAEDSQIERFTRDLMERSAGRWAVGMIGVVVIAIGVVFVVRGATSDFRKELEPGPVGPFSESMITRLGQIGWIGRGLMMTIVGWFLAQAAIDFRADEAKGIDGTLRESTGSTLGALLVLVVAVALIAYGVFCVISAPRTRLRAPTDVPVALAVLIAALAAAALVWLTSRRPAGPDPVDPEREERWIVRWIGGHPRFGAAARSLDRRVAGGLALVVGLAVTFATAFVVGVVFDMVDGDRGLARWDRAVAEWGSAHATERSTDLLSALTNLGGTGYLVLIGAGVAAYDVARWRNANVPAFLLVTIGGVALVNNALKWIVDRARPDVLHLVDAAGSSFPSGHSAAAAAGWCAFALVVSRHSPRRRRALAAAAAALVAMSVAASRALLGVHWLTDVVAGLAVGWGWFLICALAFGGRLQLLGEPTTRVAPRQSDTSAATLKTG